MFVLLAVLVRPDLLCLFACITISWIDQTVAKLNQRVRSRFADEQAALSPLPDQPSVDYQVLSVRVTRSATIEVRRVVYSVPSRLVGERLQLRLHHDKLMLYVGQTYALTLPRVYPKPGEQRARRIDYKHVIRALASKPQAFRYSSLRDDLLPNETYRQLWRCADQHLEKREACKWMVTVLRLAFEYDCETDLGEGLLAGALLGEFPSILAMQDRFLSHQTLEAGTKQPVQHPLKAYDELLWAKPRNTFEAVYS